MNISQKILLQRKKKGISQEDLANALNVSRQAVSKWESSQSVPDMDKIVALSSYFNITTDYLLKDEIETIDGADNYSSKNVDMQMLNKELSENDFQNIRYEAEKKKHTSYWLLIIAPFIMILIIFIFYSYQERVIDLCVCFGTKDTVLKLATRNIYRMNSQFSNTIIFYCSEYMELL